VSLAARESEVRLIRLTRLNRQPIVVNAELIQTVESTPDTVITLINGQKINVQETVDGVIELTLAYRRSILGATWVNR
jgi:flagellar protein FlbD